MVIRQQEARADSESLWSRRPQWLGYVVAVGAQIGVALLLDAIRPVFPLASYPIYHILVVMLIAYSFGVWPAVVAGLAGFVAFNYFAVVPVHALWPVAVGAREWAKIVAYCLGITVVTIAMVQARKSQRRIQDLADEATALNTVLARQAAELQERAHMLDLAPVLVRGIDDKIIFWNRGAEMLYGYAADEAIGKSPDELLHTVVPKPLEAIKADVMREGEWRGELQHTRRDGSVIVLASHWVLHRNEDGSPKAFIEVNIDITELKRAEEALRESEKRLRATFDNAAVGILEVDADYNFIAANDRACRILGHECSDLLKTNVQDLTFPEDRARSDEMNAKLRSGELGSFTYEKRYVRGDGSPVWVQITASAIRDDNGRFERAIAVVEDVTERRESAEALRESEERFRTLYESLPIGIVQIDPNDLRFTLFNEAAAAGLGLTMDEMAHARLPDFELLHDEALIRSNVLRFLAGERIEFETRLRTKTGEIRDVLVRGQSMYSREGPKALAIWMDITARKRAEDEIRQLNAELEQRVRDRTAELEATNKELEAFSYSVSHDLRAPLRAIDGFSTALLRHYPQVLDDRGKDYLNRVRAAAQRMAQLIDDILGLSRAGRVEMRVERVDLTEMAADIVADLRKTQPKRRVEVTIEPGMVVTADPHLLRIALDNLLGNAWKFTANRDAARIEVGAIEQNGERVYFVRDNGAGFDATYADKLFSPFQRLHSDVEFPGTGIGLALVRRILRRHGGTIWAEGAVDEGAVFYFTVPEANT